MPPRTAVIALLAAMVLVVLPLAFFLSPWIMAVFTACVVWSIRCLRRHLAMPRLWIRVLLVTAGIAGVASQYGTILGRDAGVSLFVLLTGFKLLELRSYRDTMVLLFLGYFMVLTVFLFSQALPMAAFMLVIAVIFVSVQTLLNRRSIDGQWWPLLRSSAVMLLQAAPLVLVLFVLFPRLEGPLWGMPEDAYAGMTGLGDSMAPGNLSHLAQSDKVAFRVRFDGPVPDSQYLYWRGPVLDRFDGRRWERQHRRGAPPQVVERGRVVSYHMTLEPHNRPWLLALEMPGPENTVGSLTPANELVAAKLIRDRKQYHLSSYLLSRQSGLAPIDRQSNTALPPNSNPRTRALGQRWRSLPPGQRVAKALDFIRDQPFYYTLEPPRLGRDAMDEFLFDSRRGFCEHYAGAFTLLMRAAGLPARVVTGYQGGEFNPLGGYLLVRQRNAHAWSEVWLPDSGWTRVDPTAVIPANRVDLPEETLIGRSLLADRVGLLAPGFLARGLRMLTRGLDAIDNRWNEWILGYGGEQQGQFLDRLGLGDLSPTTIGLTLVGSLIGLLLLVAGWMFWRQAPQDPVVAAYGRYCARLARRGLERGAAEGPWDYYRRVAEARPASAGQARLITALYSALRYGKTSQQNSLRHLQRLVRKFRP
jgi:transglutaminase-like putative cysteine protease